MRSILLREIIAAVDGVLIVSDFIDNSTNNVVDLVTVSGISIDSRNINIGDLFIPIKGNNFDGHNFINKAFDNGAVCALTEKSFNPPFSKYLIKVFDTGKALRDIAEYYRSLFNIPVIAITGSVGKTTTKDLVASVCESKMNVLKTVGNYNNQIGLPLTIFNLNENHDVAVLEMGMSDFGEIESLSKIAKPSVAMITNIGVAHIEHLVNREGIFKAKCEIFKYLKEDGFVVLNADDDMLCTLDYKLRNNILWYGIKNRKHFYPVEISEQGLKGSICRIRTPSGIFSCLIPQPGKHMVLNVLSACAAGYVLGLNNDDIQHGLESYIPSKMRLDIINLPNFTVINDCYNANPDSMRASLDVLSFTSSVKVAVIGDMFDLGKYENSMHYDIGKYAALNNIDQIIAIGSLSLNIYNGAKDFLSSGQQLFYFETPKEFLKLFNEIIQEGSTLLIKASRAMHFEVITNYIIDTEGENK